jgi:hypothetical protein
MTRRVSLIAAAFFNPIADLGDPPTNAPSDSDGRGSRPDARSRQRVVLDTLSIPATSVAFMSSGSTAQRSRFLERDIVEVLPSLKMGQK